MRAKNGEANEGMTGLGFYSELGADLRFLSIFTVFKIIQYCGYIILEML